MIKKPLLKEIKDYCKVNEVKDMTKLINNMLVRGFTIEKFGDTPTKSSKKPKEVIKEVIKEVEVEKIVEVIKEVPVEKIVKISDNTKINELLIQIKELEDSNIESTKKLQLNIKSQTQTILKQNKDKDILTEEYEVKINELQEIINNMMASNEGDIYGE